MKDSMRQALLRSYELRRRAGELQSEKGTADVGNRSQVTSGKHMNEIVAIMIDDIADMGIHKGDIFSRRGDVEIPGWFRAAKQWDILGFTDGQLVTGIELKSISSSYGNNLNNRAEEALGEAVDAKYANDRGLLNRVTPPLFGYALIVKKDDLSSEKCRRPRGTRFAIDPVFEDASYIDRFRIMCERLRRENIFGAVWFAVVDPVGGTVEEPVRELSYESFMAEIGGRIKAFGN